MARITIRFESSFYDFVSIHEIKDYREFLRNFGPALGMIMRPYENLFRGVGQRDDFMQNMMAVQEIMRGRGRPTTATESDVVEGARVLHQVHDYHFSHIEGEGDVYRQIWVCAGEGCDAMLTIHGRLNLESAREVQEVSRDGREENQNLESRREIGGQGRGDNTRGTPGGDRPGEVDSGQGQPREDRGSDRRDEGSGGSPTSEGGLTSWCRAGMHTECTNPNCICDCHATPESESMEAVREGNGQDADQQVEDG